MFDRNFNIIYGHRNTGRSSLLFSIASLFRIYDIKSMFLGGTEEFADHIKYDNPFDRTFFYRHQDDKFIKNISEILEKEKFDFLFIDDLDFFNHQDVKFLGNSPVRKICSCLYDRGPSFNQDYNKLEIQNSYNDDEFSEKHVIVFKKQKYNLSQFLTILTREQKLNNLLK